MVKGSEMKGVEVSEEMMEALKRTLASVEQLETELPHILSLSNPHILSQMPPLQRAHSLYTLANITSTLFSLKLRCKGINSDDHPVKAELDRLRLYQRKLEQLGDVSEAQRQDMTDIRGGEGPKMNNYQEQAGLKRKYPSSEEQSVQIAAGELVIVKKEPVEVLGDNNGTIKEPMVIDISDDDDE